MFSPDDFGEHATYAAPGGGGPVPCIIVYDRGQSRGRFAAGEVQVATADRHVWLNADDVAVVARGGTIIVPVDEETGDPLPGAETLEVRGMPKLDETGAVWSAEVVLA